MGYKVLYRKYRPSNFSELVGQKAIKEALVNSIITNRLSHAYIFTGPRGTGKTSTAKIFAKALTCINSESGDSCGKCSNCLSFNENPDIIEIDAASNNGVDEIREIRNNVKLVPTMSKYKIYIVDEVHMLSTSAWNAFLKTLEEPPAHVIFIFATTDIQKVPITVLSRCQRFDFHKLSDEEVENHIKKIAKRENFSIAEDALKSIVQLSEGCLRDCLSILDQLSKISNNIDYKLVSNVCGIVSNAHINKIILSVYNEELEDFLSIFNKVKMEGIDCNILLNQLIELLIEKAVQIKKGSVSEIDNFDFCFNLLNELFLVQSKIKYVDNPYNPLLLTLLNHFPNNKMKSKIISREIILDEKKNDNFEKKISHYDDNEYINELKNIRINNVFVDASKKEKELFSALWRDFLEKIDEKQNYSIMGCIANIRVEVVSPSYVLFSTNIESESIIFNNNLEQIENEFAKICKKNYKFIALHKDLWEVEKSKFIQNKDIKRTFIDEKSIIKENKDFLETNGVEEIFGDIVEFK